MTLEQSNWAIEPGTTLPRTEIHDSYGGRRQGGIGPSAQTPNVLIFTDPAVGAQYGYYDRWDGDTLHYTGEGQQGDQEMVQGNRAILNHDEDGRSLRVFEGSSGEVTYLGEFRVDQEDPWYFAEAPPFGGGPMRKVIMFRLKPVGALHHGGNQLHFDSLEATLSTPYMPADEGAQSEAPVPFTIDPDVMDRGRNGHKRTQNAVADAVRSAGLDPLRPGPGDPAFDVAWWGEEAFWVCEVKSLTKANETGQMRLGIGQILDYAHQLRATGLDVIPVIAVEKQPSDPRWSELCSELGIKLVWPPIDDGLDLA